MKQKIEFDYFRDSGEIVGLNTEARDFFYNKMSMSVRGRIRSVMTKSGEVFSIGDKARYVDWNGEFSEYFRIEDFDMDWTHPNLLRAWGQVDEHIGAKCYIDDLRK